MISFSWFLVPPLIYDALAEINMLHLVPLVIFKQIYREHDMRADGLLIGAEMDMELFSKHWMAWNANLLAAESLLNIWFHGYALSFMLRLLQPASFALVCMLVITFDSQFIWPEWLGMMKKVCYDQTYFCCMAVNTGLFFDFFFAEK